MKNHIKESRHFDYEGPLDVIIADLKAKSADLIDSYVENTSWGGDSCYEVIGWRPMTETELIKAKEERKREREARKRREEAAEAAERAHYERLKTKFEKEDK